MKRILIRAGKSPYTAISPETTLAANTFGANSGNYLFSHSAYRMLSLTDTELTPMGLGAPKLDPAVVNDEYDHLVLPMANAFRPGYMESLGRLTDFIEKLTIPVTILSVGAQATVAMETSHLTELNETVKRFARAVLERSPRIGVRGALTAEYLTELGFNDVEVIGCPSMFWNGPTIEVADPTADLNYSSRVSFSVTPRVKEMGDITVDHMAKFENLRLIPQDDISLSAMLWGSIPKGFDASSKLPFHPSHPLFKEDKARMFVDASPWIEYMRSMDFAFGDRIHGNVAALLGGTPAFLLAHDSRVLELANYHEIPHMLISDVIPGMDALDFAERTDLSRLRSGHASRWATFERYLADHGLDNTFNDDTGRIALDERVNLADLPPAVHALSGNPNSDVLSQRVQWLHRRITVNDSRDARRGRTLEDLRKASLKNTARVDALQKNAQRDSEALRHLKKQIDVLQVRLEALEGKRTLAQRIRRKLGSLRRTIGKK